MIEVETTCKQMRSIDNIPLSLIALEPGPHLCITHVLYMLHVIDGAHRRVRVGRQG